MILYKGQTLTSGEFTITKFDDDLNVESSYKVSEVACECPQGHKPVCRHRKMLNALLLIADTEYFYCYDDKTYRTANGVLLQSAPDSRRSLAADDGLPLPIGRASHDGPISTNEPLFRRRI